ncbi:group I truncated hemoglobin [Paremcibacter congregatus]|uniref:Group 1 truncated hemoglobin n=1 Tax=Paremcibacter congregatus TaxID=2043170 RepID=A0A2G4YVC7_9PROT|nr:group 1 truncated hemoglobin [Paremcibacter congregatus]PHZ86279.1 group 1 truncated hemoglobin [Paremcibacter congregatus]QDE27246.1 group 1 truncated hemoglobin [Paremcibacter congregatus]
MTKWFSLCAVIIALGFSTPGQAETLYDKIGGQAAITQVVTRTLDLSLQDPRIKHTFARSKMDRLAKHISDQVCQLTGGPCIYTGVTMKKAHVGLELTTLHFNALVENLQQAMREANIPTATQNKLLALLAPMHRDVVEK